MTLELSRPVPLERLPATVAVEATPEECAALALRLQIIAVNAVSCRFTLRRQGAIIEAYGILSAEIVQQCVVSLEPLGQWVAETFNIRFVPVGRESDDDDPEAPDEIPYDGNSIDLGEATAEQLALALDPYPRHPEAELDSAATDREGNPFAGLFALRRPT